ncbi:UNVERIFIED_CONTAM: hypothetical protein RMT77_000630 [Armadillidium vulgare]
METRTNLIITVLFLENALFPLVKNQELLSGIPFVLRRNHSSYIESKVPIDIFLSVWESQNGYAIPPRACSLLIPADKYFEGLMAEPLSKEFLIRALKKKSLYLETLIGMSPFPFVRDTLDEQFIGPYSFEDSSFGNAAFVKTFSLDERKIFVWRSEKDFTLLANGSKVLYEIAFDNEILEEEGKDVCVVLIVEDLAFARTHDFFKQYTAAIIRQLRLEKENSI